MTRKLHNLVGTQRSGCRRSVVTAEPRTSSMPVHAHVYHPGFYSPKAALQSSLKRPLGEGLVRRAGR